MSETLYRKYRPMSFKEVVGQDHVTTTLANQIAAENVAHAYLFTGPRGVGKTTVARLLAKAVNCEKLKGSEPCNKCESCQEVMNGNSLDVYEIDAASHTGVDNVRENIIESVRFAPNKSKFKVYVIDEVHMLSTSAFNALLKTLEEPPAHAIFVLATTEIHKVPETIISRCQRFDFKRVPAEVMIKRLSGIVKKESVEVDKEVLGEIARRSEGCLRDAESLLGQILALGETKISTDEARLVMPSTGIALVIDFIESLSKNDAPAAIAQVNQFMEEGVQLGHFTDQVIETLRTMLFASLGGLDQFKKEFDKDTAKRLDLLTKNFSSHQLLADLNILLEARRSLSRERIPQLPLELAVVEITQGDPRNSGNSDKLDNSSKQKETPDPKVKAEGEAIRVEEPLEEAPPLDPSVTIDQVKTKWKDVFNKIADCNASLPLILQSAEIISFEGGRLQLGFQFEFHAEMINETKNRLLIEDTAAAVFGGKVLIEGVHRSDERDEVVSDLVAEFGGTVTG